MLSFLTKTADHLAILKVSFLSNLSFGTMHVYTNGSRIDYGMDTLGVFPDFTHSHTLSLCPSSFTVEIMVLILTIK